MRMDFILRGKPELKNAIRNTLDQILSFNHEGVIESYCSEPLKKLNRVQREASDKRCSRFEILDEKDLLEIINEFNNSLAKIEANLKSYEREIATLESENFEDKIGEIQNKINSNFLEISTARAELDGNIMPLAPGDWSRFIADENPGFFKSIVLFFFASNQSIQEAKEECAKYDEISQRRDSLNAQIKSLEGENEGLQEEQENNKENNTKLKTKLNSIRKDRNELKKEGDRFKQLVGELEEKVKEAIPDVEKEIIHEDILDDDDDEIFHFEP